MSSVALDCVCFVVCVNLWPKAAISRGEQNRYGWRRRTLLTTRLIKFYGGLRRLMAAARGSKRKWVFLSDVQTKERPTRVLFFISVENVSIYTKFSGHVCE